LRFLATNYCTETSTTITTSSSDANFPSSNIKHPFRSKRWRATGCTTENLVFDLQTTEEINSVVLLWPKEDGIRLTNSAVIKVQANATNVWTSPAVDQTLTINNIYSVASHFFSTDQSYRYWRILITDASNPWGYIELGTVWLGKSLEIDNAENGFKYRLLDRTKTTETDFGHKYNDEYPITASLKFNYKYLDYSDIEILENAFRTNGTRKPVLVALDPTSSVYNKDHFLIYGNMGKQFELTHVNYDLFNSEGIEIEELS